MPRAPRRSFAAPFVITLAALPACSGGMRTTNPPGPPDPVVERRWTVTATGTDCVAQEHVTCPTAGSDCAQPAPMPYACPLGADGQPDTALQWPVTIHLIDGETECYADRPFTPAGEPSKPLYVLPCPS